MLIRKAIKVTGLIQGVGFRPFVYRLASRYSLAGFVRNEPDGVAIEIEGDATPVSEFLEQLRSSGPPLSRILEVRWEDKPPLQDERFRIENSRSDSRSASVVSADIAPCAACLAELASPSDRRYLYPFLNCTDCGPRFSIIWAFPYDRARTSMAGFPLCARCRVEYEDPADRRFHAEAACCPECGPSLSMDPSSPGAADPLAEAAKNLSAGKIAAVKGLGGFHLACDAENPVAVAELRRRKGRDEKPFAVMAADLAGVRRLCLLSRAEEELLSSPRRPIVLLEKRPGAPLAEGVAPANPMLGVILPYTPLHHLLMKAAGGRALVLTSANLAEEPIVFRDAGAAEKLNPFCDVLLTHDRPIQIRCDDSVARVIDGTPLFIRRSRGFAPEPIALPGAGPVVLAAGGQFKNTFGLGKGREAFLSHHVGDLDSYDNFREYKREIAWFERLFGATPQVLAHDLHPDYVSTRYALARARAEGLETCAVQHHHAHMAACLADNGLEGRAIGVCFDGTGYGPDGNVWGGEFLTGDFRDFRRAAHLRNVRMPGGEKAVREPWRMAAAFLLDAGLPLRRLEGRVEEKYLAVVTTMIEKGIRSPFTSSCGRLFDAAAALLGLRDRVSYDGQAAMELEALAASAPVEEEVYPFSFETREGLEEVDTRPLISALARDVDQGVPAVVAARRFHSTLASVVSAVCARIRAAEGLDRVVLSGGVFANAVLTVEVKRRLSAGGFSVFTHRQVPPNDGGLALGQLAVARARESGAS